MPSIQLVHKKLKMAYGDKNSVPKVEIEAVQTVTPVKQTDPRQTRRVLATDPVGSGIFRRCLNIVVYYKVVEEDSCWIVAGWFKESLGRVLADQPILGGRLRGTSSEDIGELEIVSNDSGVRLIEAKIPITLSQFLDHQSKEASEESEAQLVFWNDVDDQNPQFSPLFYLQVIKCIIIYLASEVFYFTNGFPLIVFIFYFLLLHNFGEGESFQSLESEGLEPTTSCCRCEGYIS